MKTTLCLVTHTHWDREWYLSHAQHNYRLIKLMDTLLNTLKKDASFKSFHLDGQVILIEDYLRTRPEKLKEIKKYIKEGRIKIGPFYILQDEYLISGEANIRNVLLGLKICKKYGVPSMCGYFPDAFGNISQIPQILRGFGIDSVFFGRGIIPVGYANEVLGKAADGFSEIIWKSPDGSAVIGVTFPNWYHNAYQLPDGEDEIFSRFTEIINNAQACARTPFLLGMNGCDHQPVQTNIGQIIEKARKITGMEIEHTSFDDYIEKIRPYKDSFSVFEGELQGQSGNGYGTLAGTASSRIYLKQWNYRCQHLLENILEPLSCILESYGGKYDKDIIDGCYKYLLHNHPHDSICGCSVDSVHSKMVTRFSDVYDTAESLKNDVLQDLAELIDTSCGGNKNIIVFNTQTHPVSGVIDGSVIYRIDENGKADCPLNPALFCGAEQLAASFRITEEMHYDLPRDKFRDVYKCKKLHFSVAVTNVPPTSYKILTVGEGNKEQQLTDIHAHNASASNSKIKITFNSDGTLNISALDGRCNFSSLNYFEDSGDSGNEYEYKQEGTVRLTLGSPATVTLAESHPHKAVYKTVQRLKMKDGSECAVESLITIESGSSIVKIKTTFINTVKNHRIRALFNSGLNTDHVYSFGQYDIVKRNIKPGERWKNSENPQRMESFLYMEDAAQGLIIGTRGLNEYEILRDKNTAAITLHRGVGEMGDWFYFPTEDSQCLGKCETEYAVSVFSAGNKDQALYEMTDYCKPPLEYAVTGKHGGKIKKAAALLSYDCNGFIHTGAIKKAEDGNGYIARAVNLSDGQKFAVFNKNMHTANLAETETRSCPTKTLAVDSKQIVTLRFK